MVKLLRAYQADPSLENARRLYQYSRKHPMASATLTYDDIKLLDKALRQERNDRCPSMGRPSVALAGM